MLRWQVGSGAALRRRLLCEIPPVGGDGFRGVACGRLPDGTAVAVTGVQVDGRLQVWDLATGRPRTPPVDGTTAELVAPRAMDCIGLPDGTPVAVTGGRDGVLRVWDLTTGQLRGEAPIGHAHRFGSLACTRLPHGTGIAVIATCDGTVQLWDVGALRPYGEPLSGGWRTPEVACTELTDGTPVVVTAESETIRLWDPATGSRHGPPLPVGFDVDALACMRLSDGTPLAVVGSGRIGHQDPDGERIRYGAVQAWDLATGRRYGPKLTGHGGEILCLGGTQLPDGTPIAISVDRYGTVRVWDLATGHRHGPALPHPAEPLNVACARLADGTAVAVVVEDVLRVWDLRVEPSPEGLAGPIWLVGCTRLPDDGEVVVTVGVEHRRDARVQSWDAGTGRLRGRLPTGVAAACTRLPDGIAVALAAGEPSPDGARLRRWNLATGEASELVLGGLTGRVDILDCARLSDGTPIVVIGNVAIRAWDAATGRPYGPPVPVGVGWRRALRALALPDGTLIAVHVDDNQHLQAWDLRTGRPYGPRYERTGAEIVAGTLLPDGTPVAVTAGRSRERTVRVWDLVTSRTHGQPLPLRRRWPWALACTRPPDGTTVAAVGLGDVGKDGAVQVWDLARGEERHLLAFPDPVVGLTFTAEHRLVVATELDVAAYDVLRIASRGVGLPEVRSARPANQHRRTQ